MKITKIISQVNVLYKVWYGKIGARTYKFSSFDIASIKDLANGGTITRDAVEQWILKHSGGFKELIDFSVTIGDGEFDSLWEKYNSEWMFYECIRGDNE